MWLRVIAGTLVLISSASMKLSVKEIPVWYRLKVAIRIAKESGDVENSCAAPVSEQLLLMMPPGKIEYTQI